MANIFLIIYGLGLVLIPMAYIFFFSSRSFSGWSVLHKDDLVVQLASSQVLLTMTLSGLVLLGGIKLPAEIFLLPQLQPTLSGHVEQVLLKTAWKAISSWSAMLAFFSIGVSLIVQLVLRNFLRPAEPGRSFALQAGSAIHFQCFLLPYAFLTCWLMGWFGFDMPDDATTVWGPAAVFLFSFLASSAMYLPKNEEDTYVVATIFLGFTGFVCIAIWLPDLLHFISFL